MRLSDALSRSELNLRTRSCRLRPLIRFPMLDHLNMCSGVLPIQVIPVAPPPVRPSVVMDSSNSCQDDITHQLGTIVQVCCAKTMI